MKNMLDNVLSIHKFLSSIDFYHVLDELTFSDPDTFYAFILYNISVVNDNLDFESWCKKNNIKSLFPKVNFNISYVKSMITVFGENCKSSLLYFSNAMIKYVKDKSLSTIENAFWDNAIITRDLEFNYKTLYTDKGFFTRVFHLPVVLESNNYLPLYNYILDFEIDIKDNLTHIFTLFNVCNNVCNLKSIIIDPDIKDLSIINTCNNFNVNYTMKFDIDNPTFKEAICDDISRLNEQENCFISDNRIISAVQIQYEVTYKDKEIYLYISRDFGSNRHFIHKIDNNFINLPMDKMLEKINMSNLHLYVSNKNYSVKEIVSEYYNHKNVEYFFSDFKMVMQNIYKNIYPIKLSNKNVFNGIVVIGIIVSTIKIINKSQFMFNRSIKI